MDRQAFVFSQERLNKCVADMRVPVLDGDPGPCEVVDIDHLRQLLDSAGSSLPILYRAAAQEPLLLFLERLGRAGFMAAAMRRDSAVILGDAVQAILQRSTGFERDATMAFQEVVSDLYDGFLSAQDRRTTQALEQRQLAPLVKWGRPEIGPYSFAAEQMAAVGFSCGIVNMPPAYARGGVFAWGVLGHETAGHQIVTGDAKLLSDLTRAVRVELERDDILDASDVPSATARAEDELWVWHWTRLIDELAADVLGVLNMGPAAAVSSLIYLRSLRQAYGNEPRLGGASDLLDRHPADILRLVAMAEVVRLAPGPSALLEDSAGKGQNGPSPHQLAFALELEAAKDLDELLVDGHVVKDRKRAWLAARRAARTIATAPLPALDYVSLLSVQGWRARDDRIVRMIRPWLTTVQGADERILGGVYAAHVVAAAVSEVFNTPSSSAIVFRRMVRLLAAMHEQNAAWGPLAAAYPGNVIPHRAGTGAPDFPSPVRRSRHTQSRTDGSIWPLVSASTTERGAARWHAPAFQPPASSGTGSSAIPPPF